MKQTEVDLTSGITSTLFYMFLHKNIFSLINQISNNQQPPPPPPSQLITDGFRSQKHLALLVVYQFELIKVKLPCKIIVKLHI